MPRVPPASVPVQRLIWRDGGACDGVRVVPEETPIAFTYGRATHAVMMATPADLMDFAYGFTLSEGIVAAPAEIESLDIVPVPRGIELRMDLAADRLLHLSKRQRRLAGPSGCGLCGLDSLNEAVREVPVVASDAVFTPAEIGAAQAAMTAAQALNGLTHAVHAAAFWTRAGGLVAVREDVGRHNALDKLVGAVALAGWRAGDGMVLLSSRVSVEMVQKTAVLGAAVIVAVSAPTALAVRLAATAGVTLVGVARHDGFEVFTHSQRIATGRPVHVG